MILNNIPNNLLPFSNCCPTNSSFPHETKTWKETTSNRKMQISSLCSRGSLEAFWIIMSIHSSLSLSHCERLTNDPLQPSLALRPAWKYERGRSFLFLQYKTQCGLAALDIFKWYMGNHLGQMLLLIDSNLIDWGLRLYLNVFDHHMVLFQSTYREIHPILDCVDALETLYFTWGNRALNQMCQLASLFLVKNVSDLKGF